MLYIGGVKIKTTSVYRNFAKILFVVCIFFTSLALFEATQRVFFWNPAHRDIKFIMAILLPAAATAILITADKSFEFLSEWTAAAMVLFVLCCSIDRRCLFLMASYGEFMIPYHFAYSMLAFFSVFATACIFAAVNSHRNYGFTSFYNTFFTAYTIVFLFLFVQIFIILRGDDINYQLNMIPFQGEIKNFMNSLSTVNGNIVSLLRTIGNVAFFASAPLLLARFARKSKRADIIILLSPIMLSILIEFFQAVTKTGDGDIDDVILNTAGVLIGFAVYKLFIQKLLREDRLCLE